MSDKEVIERLQEWASYLHLYTPLNPLKMVALVIRSLGWYAIVGLANLQDATNGLAVKALTILNIQNNQGFKDFLTTYQPLFIALSVLFLLVTLIGMSVNRGRDTSLFDFYRNLLIGAIVLIGFPWLWGQATSNTVAVAQYVNQSSSMSTHIVMQNLTDLEYVADKTNFDPAKFNGSGKSSDKAGLALDTTKNYLSTDENGNVSVSELNKIDPSAVIDPDHSAVKLSDDAKKILSSKLNYGSASASIVDLDGGFFGFGAEHYFRYDWNFFRIFFYQVLGILVSLILTFKVAQIGYEIWYNGAFIVGTALMDAKTGKRLLMMGQKFFVSLGAVIVIFVMQTLFNIGYAYIDDSIATSNLSGLLLNTILKIALFLTIIDGPNIFESAFGVDAGLKSATRAIIGANQGAQLLRSLGSGASNLTKSAARKVALGGGFIAGAFGAAKGNAPSPEQNAAMNDIGSSESQSKTKNTSPKSEEGGTNFNGADGKNGQKEQENSEKEGNENKASIFEQEAQRQAYEKGADEPTKGLRSGSALMDATDEEAMNQEFSNLTLPQDLRKQGQTMNEKVSDYRRNMENAVDKVKGIRQNEHQEIRKHLSDFGNPAPKSIKNSYTKSRLLGESLVKGTGNSAERRQAKRERQALYDDFFNPKPKEDEHNGY